MISEQNNLIDRYLKAGWKLIPVRNKIPLVQEWTKVDITPELVNSWREKFSPCDWGVVLKDMMVVDCDGEGAEKAYQLLGLPESLTCQTKRGFHHYFRANNVRNGQDVLNTKSEGYQIDIRGNGGYTVVPPSEGYSWVKKSPIHTISQADIERLIGSSGTGSNKSPNGGVRDAAFYQEKWEGLTEGEGRHQEALSKIGELVARKHPVQQVFALMEMWNKTNEPPLDEEWIKKKIEECWNKDVAKVEKEFGLSNDVAEFCRYIEKKIHNPEPVIRTGFERLDALIWGLNPGELHVVMADSNVGKTALSLYIGYYNAKRGKRVLYFPTESSRNSIMARLFAIFYPIRATAFRKGNFSVEETKVLRQAVQDFKTVEFKIAEIPTPSIHNVRTLVEQIKPDLVFVDYFQRCWFENESWVEYKNFAVGMKDIARLHNIPVVLTSQVHQHKIADFKSGKMKKLEVESGDIRSSKALKHEADIIIVLNERVNKLGDKFVKISVDKARDAERGNVYTKFDGNHLKFNEISEQDFLSATTEQEE